MSRVIKYRAWHFGLSRMFTAEEMTKDQLALLPDGHFANISSENTRLSRIYSHDEMLPLQFTGLHDKNGVEIYEADVIQLTDSAGEIIRVVCEYGVARRPAITTGLEVDIPSFYFKKATGFKSFPIVKNYLGIHDLEVFEVIGNIHQNPSLLTP